LGFLVKKEKEIWNKMGVYRHNTAAWLIFRKNEFTKVTTWTTVQEKHTENLREKNL
jgi:hypothetical protein